MNHIESEVATLDITFHDDCILAVVVIALVAASFQIVRAQQLPPDLLDILRGFFVSERIGRLSLGL